MPYHRDFITHIIWGHLKGNIRIKKPPRQRVIKIRTWIMKIRSIKRFGSNPYRYLFHSDLNRTSKASPSSSSDFPTIFGDFTRERTFQKPSCWFHLRLAYSTAGFLFMTDLFAIYVAQIPYLLFEIVQGQHGNYYNIINELYLNVFLLNSPVPIVPSEDVWCLKRY